MILKGLIFLIKNFFKTTAIILSLVLLISAGLSSQTKITANAATIKNVSTQVEFLGNPFNKSTFAENVWDMQVYNGRIYLGHGDYNANAGPIPVIYFNPTENKFVTQFTVQEEEIQQYKVLNGQLLIPGTDAREDSTLGNFYTLDTSNDQWVKHRTIPNADHVFDMAYFDGQLYAATGTNKACWGEVLVSKDFGNTWQTKLPLLSTSSLFTGNWATTLFELNGKVYASGKMIFPSASIAPSMAKYTNLLAMTQTSSSIQPYTVSFAPLSKMTYNYFIQRPMTVNNNLVFFNYRSTASHWMPDSMYIATSLTQSRRVIFPENTAVPSDIVVRDGMTYVLAFNKNTSGTYTNIVYQSADLLTWTEVFSFDTDTFARSFEELNGDFYFGLGCDYGSTIASTGNILRVAKNAYADQSDVVPVSLPVDTPTLASDPSIIPQNVVTLILDNTDSSFISNSTWIPDTSVSGYYGTNSIYDGSLTGDQNKWAMWIPPITEPGEYDIYLRWTADKNRPISVPLEIKYNGGIDTTKSINQQTNNATWVLIGRYYLTADSSNYIKILCSSPGYTVADAVKFEKINQ